MSIAEHMRDHIILGLEFRFPAEGNTYFKFDMVNNKVELYVNGVLKQEWT